MKYIVIGGTSGIGEAISKKLIDDGNYVEILSRKPKQLNFNTDSYTHHTVDVTDENPNFPEIEGPIDGLVYCPGSINLKPFRGLKSDDFLNDWSVNLLGAVKAIQFYLKGLKQANQSSILLFSTVAVKTGMSFHASTAAAKGAVEGLGKSLAAELAPNIRVNIIAPSLTDTPLAENLLNNEKKREASVQRHPLKRIAQPEEIAALAGFLLSDKAAVITGQVIQADSGLSGIR